jgi:radical SAM protein with 4Fe4S-binding SPASM domain
MCSRWQWPPGTEMTTSEIAALLRDLRDAGTYKVTLTGGEPTMREDWVDLVALGLAESLRTAVVTNGLLITRRIDDLARVPYATTGRFSVAISLLGATAATHEAATRTPGSYARAIEALDALRSAHVRTGIFFTVLPGNVGELVDAVFLACRHRATDLRFGFLHGHPSIAFKAHDLFGLKPQIEAVGELRKKHNLAPLCDSEPPPKVTFESALYRSLFSGLITERDLREGTLARCVVESSDVFCDYTRHCAFIDPAGDVYPCYYAYASNESFEEYRAQRAEYRMGNVLESPVRDIWSGDRYRAFFERVNPVRSDDRALHEVCRQCVMCLRFARCDVKGGMRSETIKTGSAMGGGR